MLKSYATRVRATYDLIAQILEEFNAHPGQSARGRRHKADNNTVARAAQANAALPIVLKASEKSVPFALKRRRIHPVAQRHLRRYLDAIRSGETEDVSRFQYWRDLVVAESARLPAAYLIPAAWPQIVEKLRQHGLRVEPLAHAVTLNVERYRLSDPKWADAPFEGRLMLKGFGEKMENVADLKFAPGAVLVTLDQRAANVAVNLLEPQAPDSLLHWGFLNAIFEQKESGDARVLEKLAREMLAKDPALKTQFEERLKNDPAFAGNPEARLEFFYRRSPWYLYQDVGVYPIVKLDAAALAAARAQ